MSGMIALAGWGQPHDALRDAAPKATHIEYAHTRSLEGALELLSAHAKASTVIGWSMGGQLAVEAIARGILKPETLVLIATPLRLPQATLAQFRDNYKRNPERTLDKAYALIAYNDTRAGYVEQKLSEARARINPKDWLIWLDMLSTQDYRKMDFKHFPRTLLIHGDRDVVVDIAQSRMFHEKLSNSEMHVFEGCGHAPHWHDTARTQAIISGDAS